MRMRAPPSTVVVATSCAVQRLLRGFSGRAASMSARVDPCIAQWGGALSCLVDGSFLCSQYSQYSQSESWRSSSRAKLNVTEPKERSSFSKELWLASKQL